MAAIAQDYWEFQLFNIDVLVIFLAFGLVFEGLAAILLWLFLFRWISIDSITIDSVHKTFQLEFYLVSFQM